MKLETKKNLIIYTTIALIIAMPFFAFVWIIIGALLHESLPIKEPTNMGKIRVIKRSVGGHTHCYQ